MVSLSGEALRVSAPRLQFLEGKTMERLQDGVPLSFIFQLSLSLDAHASIRTRALERFSFSYDLWEEKISVVKTGSPAAAASHLGARAAERWCLDHLTLSTAGLAEDRPFWIRLEVRGEDPKEDPGLLSSPAATFSRLVEIFSRPARGQQMRWQDQVGPLRLMDLKKRGGLRRDQLSAAGVPAPPGTGTL
jgi:hypothetical protein